MVEGRIEPKDTQEGDRGARGGHGNSVAAWTCVSIIMFGSLLMCLSTVAHIYAASGKKEQARQLLEELIELAKSKYVSPYGVAVVYAALGEEEHAFKWLQTATEEHAAGVIYLKVDPRLDSLRAEPRFRSLLHSVGLSGSSNE